MRRLLIISSILLAVNGCQANKPLAPLEGLYYCNLGEDTRALFEFNQNGEIDLYTTDDPYNYVDTLEYEIKGNKYYLIIKDDEYLMTVSDTSINMIEIGWVCSLLDAE